MKPHYIPVKVTGKIDGIPVSPFVTRIEQFWNRYDEDGVKRTIKIDECDRARVSRELADWIDSSDPRIFRKANKHDEKR